MDDKDGDHLSVHLSTKQLQKALKQLQDESDTARVTVRQCNIQVIETTKAVKPCQADYQKLTKT